MIRKPLRISMQYFGDVTPPIEIPALTDPTPAPAPAPRLFTQEEVSAMMTKEKNQGRMAVLNELGVVDAKSAKDGLAGYKAWVESQQTDLQKAQGALATTDTARVTAETKAALLESKLEAIKQGCIPDFVDDVVALAQVKVNDTTDFSAVITALKVKYPSFFTTSATIPPVTPQGTGNSMGTTGKPNASIPSIGSRLGALARTTTKSTYFTNE